MDIGIIGKVHEAHQPARVWCDVLERLGHTVYRFDVTHPDKPTFPEKLDVLVLTQINNFYNPDLLPPRWITIGYLFENPFPISFTKCDILVAGQDSFLAAYSKVGDRNCVPLIAPSFVDHVEVDAIPGTTDRKPGLHFHGSFHCPKSYYNRMHILNELMHQGFEFDLLQPLPEPYDYTAYLTKLKHEEMQLVFMSDDQYTSGRLYENALCGSLNVIHTPSLLLKQKLRNMGWRHGENCFMFGKPEFISGLFDLSPEQIQTMCANADKLVREKYTAEIALQQIFWIANNMLMEETGYV